MGDHQVLRLGASGARRGASLIRALPSSADVQYVAVYEPAEEARTRFAQAHPDIPMVMDFGALLDSGLDALYIASPNQHHAPQAVAALGRGVHVLSEVPPAVSMEQAHALVGAVRQSEAVYMLAENYCYTPPNETVLALARQGAFGALYYGEASYIGALPARRLEGDSWWARWLVGQDGVTYPTHPLGPLLEWFDGRVTAVSCAGAGRHTRHAQQESAVLLARLDNGALLQVRFDLLSSRPAELFYNALQGTGGAYEAPRGPWDRPRLHLTGKTPEGEWEPLDPLIERHAHYAVHQNLPWGSPAAPAVDFIGTIRAGSYPRFDVFRALDLTLPGLISSTSIASGGAWVAVPDPRTFTDGIGCAP